jgi:methylmalonyl-CoA mutase
VPQHADWQRLVTEVLKKSGVSPEGFAGAPERLLISETYDGIEIQPLYTAEDPGASERYRCRRGR